MRIRTMLVLAVALVNALWLAHVFAFLGLFGYYPIREPVSWVAWGEMCLMLVIAGATVERIIRLRER